MEPQSPRTARSNEEPFAVQFSVFLANRVGQLRDLLQLMVEKQVSVLGISVVDSADWAVIRMIVSDPNKARVVLHNEAIPFTDSPVLLVCMPEAGSLSAACSILVQAEVNVHFAYPLLVRYDETPVMVFHVDEDVVATHILMSHGFTVLGEEDLADH